ncbi:hypothetical protein MIR68_001380 [Amoeboaphelidium protococcarum]|nr:hypothetical protein MIR68_001380 [Amoeboaphelidium protococcarum]
MKTTILATVATIIACSSNLVAADDHKDFKVLVTPKLKYHDASKYCKIQGYSLIDVTSENFNPLSKFVSKKLGKDPVWIRSWNGDDYEQKYGQTPLALTPMSKFGKGSINVRKDYGLKLRGICQLYPRVSYGYKKKDYGKKDYESRSISNNSYGYDDKTGVYKVPTYGYDSEKKDYGYGDKENYGSGDKKDYGYENKKEHDYEVEKPHYGYDEPSYGYDHVKQYGVRDLKVDNKDYEKKDYEKKDYGKKDYGKDEKKDYGKDYEKKDYGKEKKDYGKDDKKDYGKDDKKPEDGYEKPYPMPTWE